jgi:predicted NBD/HSP70 family sugar kinase
VLVNLALRRTDGTTSRWSMTLDREDATQAARPLTHLISTIKFLLWSRGGITLLVHGPDVVVQRLRQAVGPGGILHFDAGLMERAYGQPLAVEACDASALPPAREGGPPLGGHWQGCRLGFDLGASDFKIAAVREGEVVFSAEHPWQPVTQPDPAYHYERLRAGLNEAATHLPRVDAIGGSSAGILVNNQIRVASLFRAVPPNLFADQVRSFFLRMQQEWKVPLAVVNDGDVTALAGALALQQTSILGIAMGSSEAAGFLDGDGRILGWLNELAFAPVDARADAPRDEWSGAPGVGAQYFSQQAVNRLLKPAGIELPNAMPLPEKLCAVQALAQQGDPRAERIFETIGVYLGHTLPLYHHFYSFRHSLILGRVTSGRGGELVLEHAHRTLATRYAGREIPFHIQVPDEKSRRVGQAVAAASLPLWPGA